MAVPYGAEIRWFNSTKGHAREVSTHARKGQVKVFRHCTKGGHDRTSHRSHTCLPLILLFARERKDSWRSLLSDSQDSSMPSSS